MPLVLLGGVILQTSSYLLQREKNTQVQPDTSGAHPSGALDRQ